jgi:hypothetical protein
MHRSSEFINDVFGSSGSSLLDGRIDLDRIEWNAANLPLHFAIANPDYARR